MSADGGPAFPMQDSQAIHAYAQAKVIGVEGTDERDRVYTQARADAVGGMTLRDYFAVHADIGDVDQLSVPVGVVLLGRDVPEFKKDGTGCYAWWAEYRAKLRYIEADAMLKARSA